MKEILQDVCDMFGKGQGEEGTNKIIKSIKNVMSDCTKNLMRFSQVTAQIYCQMGHFICR